MGYGEPRHLQLLPKEARSAALGRRARLRACDLGGSVSAYDGACDALLPRPSRVHCQQPGRDIYYIRIYTYIFDIYYFIIIILYSIDSMKFYVIF